MQKKLVMFDFDGVLVRTAEIGYTLHTQANLHLSREYFANLSNGNFVENLERAIREDRYQVQENWEDLYNAELLKLSSHDVIRGLVLDLAKEYHLAVVSSSHASHIRDFLRKEEIDHCFSHVLGWDTHASKVVKIRSLLESYSLNPKDAVFITDTLGDIREGNACSVPCIGVTWGTHERETLALGNPFCIVDSVIELKKAVEDSLGVIH